MMYTAKKLNHQIIYGNVPSKSNGYKIIRIKNKKGVYRYSLGKTDKLKRYERDFYRQYVNRGMISSDFTLDLFVHFKSKNQDLDGSLKIILDCLQKVGAIKNDNNCVELNVTKLINFMHPKIELLITEK